MILSLSLSVKMTICGRGTEYDYENCDIAGFTVRESRRKRENGQHAGNDPHEVAMQMTIRTTNRSRPRGLPFMRTDKGQNIVRSVARARAYGFRRRPRETGSR